MKIMTSATFIMTIPAIIAGLYGMNVKLPSECIVRLLADYASSDVDFLVGFSNYVAETDVLITL